MGRRPRISTLCPYTTLFRSGGDIPAHIWHDFVSEAEHVLGAPAPAARTPAPPSAVAAAAQPEPTGFAGGEAPDRKSTRLNSSHPSISYAVFCLKKKNNRSRAFNYRTPRYERRICCLC